MLSTVYKCRNRCSTAEPPFEFTICHLEWKLARDLLVEQTSCNSEYFTRFKNYKYRVSADKRRALKVSVL